MVMISAQVAAALALTIRPVAVARLLIFVLAAVKEALLVVRMAAFFISLLESLVQVEMALAAESSNFRHFWKAEVQLCRAFVMAADSLLALQFFTAEAVMFSSCQQEQALGMLVPLIVISRHSPAFFVNLSTRVLQLLMKVTFGWGMLAGLQALFTLISQAKRVSVRFFRFAAPLLVV